MPWWVYYTITASVLVLINEGWRRKVLLLIIGGLLFVQVWKYLLIGDLIWLAFAASWVFVAGAIKRHSVPIFALTLSSAICYAYGRARGAEFAGAWPPWESPLFFADLPIIIAIVVSGWSGLARVGRDIARGSWLGGYSHRGSARLGTYHLLRKKTRPED